MEIKFEPFQIEKIKKIKGNFLVVYIGDEKHIPTREYVENMYIRLKEHLPRGMKFLVLPYYNRIEVV